MKQTMTLPSLARSSEASRPSIFCLSDMPGGSGGRVEISTILGERGRGVGMAGASGSVGLSIAMLKVRPQSVSHLSASVGR